MVELFPFSEYWWFYLAFVGLVVLLLALDLGVFHRKAHVVSFREAATGPSSGSVWPYSSMCCFTSTRFGSFQATRG